MGREGLSHLLGAARFVSWAAAGGSTYSCLDEPTRRGLTVLQMRVTGFFWSGAFVSSALIVQGQLLTDHRKNLRAQKHQTTRLAALQQTEGRALQTLQ